MRCWLATGLRRHCSGSPFWETALRPMPSAGRCPGPRPARGQTTCWRWWRRVRRAGLTGTLRGAALQRRGGARHCATRCATRLGVAPCSAASLLAAAMSLPPLSCPCPPPILSRRRCLGAAHTRSWLPRGLCVQRHGPARVQAGWVRGSLRRCDAAAWRRGGGVNQSCAPPCLVTTISVAALTGQQPVPRTGPPRQIATRTACTARKGHTRSAASARNTGHGGCGIRCSELEGRGQRVLQGGAIPAGCCPVLQGFEARTGPQGPGCAVQVRSSTGGIDRPGASHGAAC